MLYNSTIQQDSIVQHITTINPSPTQLNNTLLYNTIQQDIRMQHNTKEYYNTKKIQQVMR